MGSRRSIPRIQEIVPEGVKVKLLIDASGFVKHAIADVAFEMVIAAALVGLIVLLLLGSWRPTVIVAHLDPAVHPDLAHRPARGSDSRSIS